MAKNLALLALILGIVSLFLPTTESIDGQAVVGVLAGNKTSMAGLYLMGPPTFAALLGATLGRRRFGRGLGVVHILFGILGLLMCAMILDDESVKRGEVLAGMGTYLAAASGLLALIAGLIGLLKPDPKR
jgi:hypothetical protein